MAAPTKIYALQIKAAVTAEQLTKVERECALAECTTSEVIRASLLMYFDAPPSKRRRYRAAK